LASEDVVSEAKVTIMKIKINTKTTISGIDLHWNYQKQRSPVSIYTGTIKNNDLRYRSTLELSKTHISGIDLRWNYQKHISLGSIYTGTIKNTYPSTFGSYIEELLVQKY
jgi:hypothetical protein